eukprot:747779-Hanusia_phi.AAC.2
MEARRSTTELVEECGIAQERPADLDRRQETRDVGSASVSLCAPAAALTSSCQQHASRPQGHAGRTRHPPARRSQWSSDHPAGRERRRVLGLHRPCQPSRPPCLLSYWAGAGRGHGAEAQPGRRLPGLQRAGEEEAEAEEGGAEGGA